MVPPVGAAQGLLQPPQWAIEVFQSKQSLPHLSNPELHVTVQLLPLQAGEP